ncbi:hypothetical protein M422DRAFT_178739 [Sphaerobolus stellatus SS14]|uniref:Chromo domain-containing protein n=1 Tax=Sphaerobolus stellatus (strain SS14) TaxID=990650 RepID=A0A0C9U2G1_SPHS4|nr:hypothetical protein M422DRAFT_178739 [Sphaerobolus stellatus SS14]
MHSSSNVPSTHPFHELSFRLSYTRSSRCSSWYHWGCVNVNEEHPAILNDADFICELCVFEKSVHRNDPERCSWPGCLEPEDKRDPDEFFVERLIGRYDRGGKGRARYTWLVKWEGYPVTVATWEPGNMLDQPAKLIEDFELAAKEKGAVKRADLILLQEAIDGGWEHRRV